MERGRDIIPSFLSLKSTPQYDDGGAFDNWALRFGEVQKIIYPDEEASRSKKFVEYNVFVQHRQANTGTGTIYYNCMLNNAFGGIADRCQYMLRAPDKPSVATEKNGLGLGSKVLILCLNGEQNNAYIVGGKRDPDHNDDFDKKAKDLGHFYYWTFNGITMYVDKDGQFLLEYGGKREIDGKRSDDVDEGNTKTALKLLKDGNASLADKDAKTGLYIDHGNGEFLISRDKKFKLGDATDKMLLGESFRQNHKQMHGKLKQMFSTLKDLLQQAGTQLNTTVSTAPGAPIPTVQAAGALLISASQVAGQISQAIDSFETAGENKNSYLSDKNFSD
jgi:hypothetical protein